MCLGGSKSAPTPAPLPAPPPPPLPVAEMPQIASQDQANLTSKKVGVSLLRIDRTGPSGLGPTGLMIPAG
jgi:hypothetical protein